MRFNRLCEECKHYKKCTYDHKGNPCPEFARPWYSPTLFAELLINFGLKAWGKQKDKPEPKPKPKPTGCPYYHGGRKSTKVKPHSHNDGNLVIVFRGDWCPCMIEAVFVSGERSYQVYKSYEEGASGCKEIDGKLFGRNENATHARFQSPGEAYGRATLRVVFKDGSEKARVFDMGLEKSYDFK